MDSAKIFWRNKKENLEESEQLMLQQFTLLCSRQPYNDVVEAHAIYSLCMVLNELELLLSEYIAKM